jgi:hypothetical protein
MQNTQRTRCLRRETTRVGSKHQDGPNVPVPIWEPIPAPKVGTFTEGENTSDEMDRSERPVFSMKQATLAVFDRPRNAKLAADLHRKDRDAHLGLPRAKLPSKASPGRPTSPIYTPARERRDSSPPMPFDRYAESLRVPNGLAFEDRYDFGASFNTVNLVRKESIRGRRGEWLYRKPQKKADSAQLPPVTGSDDDYTDYDYSDDD